MNELKTSLDIYNETIALLDVIEITITDAEQFKYVRKRLLNIANDVKRLGESNG